MSSISPTSPKFFASQVEASSKSKLLIGRSFVPLQKNPLPIAPPPGLGFEDSNAKNYTTSAYSNRRQIVRSPTFSEALKIFNQGAENGFKSNTITFNHLLSKCEDITEGLRILDRMKSEDIDRDVITYTNLIKLCGKNTANAFEIRKMMEEDGVAPNDFTYNTLIQVCVNAERLDLAHRVLKEMKESPTTKPDVVTYTSLIHLCVILEYYARAELYFSEMKDNHIFPNRQTFTVMINASQTLEKAYIYFNQMIKRYPPNEITYTSLINICAKTGDSEQAVEFFNMMQLKGYKADKFAYTALIRAHINADKLDRAIEIYKLMKSSEIDSDLRTFSSLISACIRAQNFTQAIELYQEMEACGIKKDLSMNSMGRFLTRKAKELNLGNVG